ncbi:hypothetical protein K2173_001222 [Erythroxylum novogranatense]|uniref:Uncharacterized protein n=1 Tax=Erythroxylum novogranatense TaxID=1862640 RepID=A0AAV8T335_9ROSI|nr:hypothetical protein K2173_001222 [Erythroxylum novogranatense]
MATLQKFKLLATQCAVAGTPTQSPTASPVFHIRRRRKTLRMLLSRSTDRRRRFPRHDDESELQIGEDPPEKRVRRKLKDLFVSSPPFEDKEKNRDGGEIGLLPVSNGSSGGGGGGSGGGLAVRRGGVGGMRPISGTFRYRLLRRAWRPMLVTIPE